MSRGSVLVLAYSNGKMFQGEEGDMFDGLDPSMFEISSLATFKVLKQKIHSKLNLEANQEVSKVTYRFPISANKYKSVQLKSDDDVRCMFHCHAKHSDLNAIELLVEIHRFVEAQSPLRDGSNNGLHPAERSSTRQMKGVLRGGSLVSGRRTR